LLWGNKRIVCDFLAAYKGNHTDLRGDQYRPFVLVRSEACDDSMEFKEQVWTVIAGLLAGPFLLLVAPGAGVNRAGVGVSIGKATEKDGN
jgi:hypothetical protein